MPQTGPRFKGTDKAALYSAVVALTQDQPRSAEYLVETVKPRFNPSPSLAGMQSYLRLWTAAGALAITHLPRTEAGSVSAWGGYRNGYRSTSKALSPSVILKALGTQAGYLLEEAQATELALQRRREEADRAGQALAVPEAEPYRDPPEVVRTPIDMGHRHEPNPGRFFEASFGPDGVTITYEEYLRVVQLLARLTEGGR